MRRNKEMERRDENLVCAMEVAYTMFVVWSLWMIFGPWFFNLKAVILLALANILAFIWSIICVQIPKCHMVSMTLAAVAFFFVKLLIALPVVILLRGLSEVRPFVKSRYVRLLKCERARYKKSMK